MNIYENENKFYLYTPENRLAKFYAQTKLFEKTINVPGNIIEFGVFKGVSLLRFIKLRKVFGIEDKQLIGFDTFAEFPQPESHSENTDLEKFINSAGSSSIKKDELYKIISSQKLELNVELVEGDILNTLPEWISRNPNARFSFINLDVDLKKPTSKILELVYPLVNPGGIILLDDYTFFSEATETIDEYCRAKNIKIRKYDWTHCPYYLIKEKNE